MPQEFENPNQEKSHSVEGGGPIASKNKGKHSFENLPPDAQGRCTQWVTDGLMTQDEYLADYEW